MKMKFGVSSFECKTEIFLVKVEMGNDDREGEK